MMEPEPSTAGTVTHGREARSSTLSEAREKPGEIFKGGKHSLAIPEREIIAVVGFSTKRSRPIANKKFPERDAPQRAAAYLLEVLLRKETDFVSIRKIRREPGEE